MQSYTKICSKVAESLGEEDLKAFLRQCLVKCRGGNLVSSVLYTVKTHKPVGQVSARLIHSSSLHPFSGLSSIFKKMFAEQLGPLPHLVRNTDDLVRKVTSKRYGNHFGFIKLDIKDFYLNGEHRKIVDIVGATFIENQRGVLKDALLFLLYHQYVQSDLLPEETWRVALGSGIGQKHSGELSDLYLYRLAERHWAANAAQTGPLGILDYFRYRDDILLVISNISGYISFMTKFRELTAADYVVEVDKMSWWEINMLDDTFFKGPRFKATGFLDVRPFLKPTDQKLPLSSVSFHSPSVHWSWPRAEILRIRGRASSPNSFYSAKHQMISWLSRHGVDPAVVERAAKVNFESPPLSVARVPEYGTTFWLRLPYHRLVHSSGIRRILRDTLEKWRPVVGSLLGSCGFTVRVAWLQSGPNMLTYAIRGWQ